MWMMSSSRPRTLLLWSQTWSKLLTVFVSTSGSLTQQSVCLEFVPDSYWVSSWAIRVLKLAQNRFEQSLRWLNLTMSKMFRNWQGAWQPSIIFSHDSRRKVYPSLSCWKRQASLSGQSKLMKPSRNSKSTCPPLQFLLHPRSTNHSYFTLQLLLW